MALEMELSEWDKQRIKDKKEDILLHPDSIEKNQDIGCPKIFWDGVGHGSGIGKWSCILNSISHGDSSHGGSNENVEYFLCDCQDYTSCSRFY